MFLLHLFSTIVHINSYILDFITTSISLSVRLSQPAQLVIDFSVSEEVNADAVLISNNTGDLLVLNLQETELSIRNYVNDVPNVESCYTSLLHIR